MRLAADPFNVVGADLEVEEGLLALSVSNHEVGEWRLDQVTIEMAPDGFHMRVDGEEFIFMTPERSQLAHVLGVNGTRREAPVAKARDRRPRPSRSAPRPPKAPRSRRNTPRWKEQLGDQRVRILAGLLAVMITLGVVAQGVLTAMLLFAGISGVVIAGAAILDPLLAARLPGEVSPIRWAVAGLVATASGMVLLIF